MARAGNASRAGKAVSRATIEKARREFDALPVSVKAAAWDAIQPWSAIAIVKAFKAGGERAAIRLLTGADAWAIENDRSLWMAKRRPGTRREDMPLTPHQSAGATQLRSHAAYYQQPAALPRTA